MTKQEMYRQLRSLGFSAEQAIAEMTGDSDDTYDGQLAKMAASAPVQTASNGHKRTVQVAVPTPRRARGPMLEYFAKPVRKGAKLTIPMGNNTDVYKVLSRTDRKGNPVALTVPAIAELTGIPAHSVESNVYQLRTMGLVDKRPVNRG